MMGKNETDGILVSAACFRQRVVLPAAQVAGLSESELATALAFEVEPFSGVPRAEGELAWRAAEEADPARRAYDVVQIRRTDLEEALARARTEKRRVRSVTAAPDEARGERLQDLPAIPVRAKGVFRAHPLALWGAACLVLACGLAADGLLLRGEVKDLRRDVAVRRELQSEKDALESRAGGLRRQAADIRAKRADEARAQERAAAFRAAARVLLEAVPRACADESVVREIRAGEAPLDLRVSGVALSPEAATRTVARLTETLSAGKSGWSVRPGSVCMQTSGEACAFDCTFAFDPERSGR